MSGPRGLEAGRAGAPAALAQGRQPEERGDHRAESGDDHAKSFRVSCRLEEPPLAGEGEGSSRRAAEQAAAEVVLAKLEAA